MLDVVKAGNVESLSHLVEAVSAYALLAPFGEEGSALAVASQANHIPMVWYLVKTIGLSLGSKVNAANDTALHVAARAGHLDLVTKIAPFIDVGAKNVEGRSAACEACVNDQAPVVQYLIHTFPNKAPNLANLVYLAVNAKALRVLAMLLPRAKAVLRDDKRVLQLAVELKDEKICRLLLDNAANTSSLDTDSLNFVRGLQGHQTSVSRPSATPPSSRDLPGAAAPKERPDRPRSPTASPSSSPRSPQRATATTPLPRLLFSGNSTPRLNEQFATGQHSDWGTVFKQKVASTDVETAKTFHKDFIRLQRSSAGRAHAIVRYVGTDADDGTLLFEPPGIALERAGESPPPEVFANCNGQSWRQAGFLHDIVDAVAYLHECGRPHGAINPSHCFVDPKSGSGKLLLVFKGSAPTAFTAPEAHQASGFDPLAADVYSLGRVLLSVRGLNVTQEALDLANHMTSAQPTHRPKMADVIAHPTWWTHKEKLQYIQTIASYSADNSRVAACKNLRCSNWQVKLPPVVLAGTNQHRTYNPTVYALVRYIRNFKEHGRDHSPAMWQALQDSLGDTTPIADVSDLEFQEICLGTFVERAFPTLMLDLWRALGSLASTS